jgi:hypothetical protein
VSKEAVVASTVLALNDWNWNCSTISMRVDKGRLLKRGTNRPVDKTMTIFKSMDPRSAAVTGQWRFLIDLMNANTGFEEI